MSVTSTKKSNVKELKLLNSGQFVYNNDQNLPANSFNTLRAINAKNIDLARLQIFVYGHGDSSATVIPNMGNVGFIGGNTLIPGYQIQSGIVNIGIFCSGSGLTPTAPYHPITMGYFIMYY